MTTERLAESGSWEEQFLVEECQCSMQSYQNEVRAQPKELQDRQQLQQDLNLTLDRIQQTTISIIPTGPCIYKVLLCKSVVNKHRK